ncbi:MAG: hypothetical protein NZ957_01300 [Thaumarchaeota archaeon]|nr:hypothetical protein [Candidatus Calditenuaceae archaeon]MDW8041700.1 hypothetical protein [Nitrososphaerota archaeon]
MEIGFPVKEVVEGKARLIVPEGVGRVEPSKLPAFYNPASKTSRDIAVLVTKAFFDSGEKTFAEPLAGLGARSVRLMLETSRFVRGYASDINENSAKLIDINARVNGLEGSLKGFHTDGNLLLVELAAKGSKVDYVDLDPSGSPARFLENAIRAVRSGGMVGVSATDLAALTGASPRTARWRYSLVLSRTVFGKEVAQRALAAFCAVTAGRLSKSAVPVASICHGHFVRVFALVERGKLKAYESIVKVGYLRYCDACLRVDQVRELSEPQDRCGSCGSVTRLLGPIWLGPLKDDTLIERALRLDLAEDPVYKVAVKVLRRGLEELPDVPYAYPVSELSRRGRCSPPKVSTLIDELRSIGYRASPVHYDGSSIKTDAPISEIMRLLRA